MECPRTRNGLSALGALALVAAASCSSGGAPTGLADADAASPIGSWGDARIEAAAATYATFAQMNRAPFPTQQHAGNPMVNVYANEVGAATYRAIDPATSPAAGFSFAPGSMLVKEMLGATGAAEVLTVMYKKDKGYDPAHDDWWYGRLDPRGAPTQPGYAGTIDFCVACHEGARRSDHVWGLAAGR